MEVSIKQIINSRDILQKLGQQKMSIIAAYKMQSNMANINAEFKKIYDTVSLVQQKYQHADSVEDLQSKNEEFQKEIDELEKEMVNVDISQIKVEDIGCDMTPFELMAISWMLV